MSRRILIVEDDPFVSIMLAGYLEALGHDVVACAETLSGALAFVDRGEFDTAIVDIHLANGETSGPVVEALRRAGLPFVVTTGVQQAEDEAFAGAQLLTKPFGLVALENALADLKQTAEIPE